MRIWAFNNPTDKDTGNDERDRIRKLVAESVRSGKSRFGYSSEDRANLNLSNEWIDEEWREWGQQLSLLDVEENDWIVHINVPEWGRCTAAQVLCDYDFDDGLEVSWGRDYRHFFGINKETVIEFDRNDPNVLPTVNLRPRRRRQRIYDVDDFLQSIENLRRNRVNLSEGERRETYFLKEKTEEYLKKITELIQRTHQGKKLESFLAEVFRKIPGVVHVKENGSRWGTDYGADLIVTTSVSLGHLQFDNKIIVQIKSFEDRHYDLGAVEQVESGIRQFFGTAGMIITTAEETEELESAVRQASERVEVPIDILASADVAKFVIKHAPELVFRLDGVA